jgi:hypothetical protein
LNGKTSYVDHHFLVPKTTALFLKYGSYLHLPEICLVWEDRKREGIRDYAKRPNLNSRDALGWMWEKSPQNH